MSRDDVWHVDGPDTRPERAGLLQALRALHLPRREPTEEDAPPLSTFPMTPAARAALRQSRKRDKGGSL